MDSEQRLESFVPVDVRFRAKRRRLEREQNLPPYFAPSE